MNDYEDVDWTLVDFTEPKKPGGEQKSPPASKVCPKCGKELGRGGHFHVRACKG